MRWWDVNGGPQLSFRCWLSLEEILLVLIADTVGPAVLSLLLIVCRCMHLTHTAVLPIKEFSKPEHGRMLLKLMLMSMQSSLSCPAAALVFMTGNDVDDMPADRQTVRCRQRARCGSYSASDALHQRLAPSPEQYR